MTLRNKTHKSKKKGVEARMKIKEVGKPGFRYRIDFERPDAELVAAFGALMEQTGCLTGNVGDCLGRNAAGQARRPGLDDILKQKGIH